MMRATILGCGSSGGVPRFGPDGGNWGDCDPQNPKNRRRRCALLIEKFGPGEGKTTRICIDAGPDFRSQMLDAQVPMLDALIISHEHADHIHGIDDMRQFVNLKVDDEITRLGGRENIELTRALYLELVEAARIDCYAGLSAHGELASRFDYLFNTQPGHHYPPIMHLHHIGGEFQIEGAGGVISLIPFAVPHGGMDALGFRIGGLVYLPDVFDLTDEARGMIAGADHLIIDCLQYRPHGTHTHFEKTMRWIDELSPKRAVLTNLHNSMDYEKLMRATPDHVEPAFDHMMITL